jgi:UDP-N-acetyl-D-mannosaminuronic acid transferase (WecB/TagA/CpsF family)
MFRLITEPGRLWNRYLIGIPLFIYRILKLKFEGKII